MGRQWINPVKVPQPASIKATRRCPFCHLTLHRLISGQDRCETLFCPAYMSTPLQVFPGRPGE